MKTLRALAALLSYPTAELVGASDEIRGVLRRETGVGHLILDEAQDASAMQLRAVGRRCEQGAATVLGDIAQGTTPWSTASWSQALAHLGKADGSVVELTRGFRVPASVLVTVTSTTAPFEAMSGARMSVRPLR